MTKCIFCDSEKINVERNDLIYSIDCENCGKYRASDPFLMNSSLSELEKNAVKWFLSFNDDIFISNDYSSPGAVLIDFIVQEYKKYK